MPEKLKEKQKLKLITARIFETQNDWVSDLKFEFNFALRELLQMGIIASKRFKTVDSREFDRLLKEFGQNEKNRKPHSARNAQGSGRK